jgi:hypothetical protein
MINNFLINRVLSVTGFDKDENILYRLTQPQNVSLSTSSETAEVVDALGTPIAVFDRSKSAELSGENAIFDLSLLAEQHGVTVKDTADAVPAFEVIDITADKKGTAIPLSHTPIDDTMVKAYALNGDSSIAKALNASVAAGKITIPETTASQILVSYEYKPAAASMVVVSSDNFATAHKIVVEILGCDVCNTEDLIYAYLVMENAKMSSDTELSFGTDLVHSFNVSAQVSYCSTDKRLFYIVIPEDAN